MMTDTQIRLLKEELKRNTRVYWMDPDKVAHSVRGVQLKWVENKDEPDLAEPVAKLASGKVVALLNVDISEFVMVQPLHLQSWHVPTQYVDRFIQAMQLLCLGNSPSREMVESWFSSDNDDLQQWAVNNTAMTWATGIGTIEAAMALADTPEEGISGGNGQEHQTREEAFPQNHPESAPAVGLITRDKLTDDEDAIVNAGFADYNSDQDQESTRKPIAVVVYSEEGELVGALDGYVFFDWLTVSRLWVAENARGQGIGTKLMLEAERIAKAEDCAGSTLSTYDFQAKPFYEKLGYEVFGVLQDNPRNRKRFFMRKTILN